MWNTRTNFFYFQQEKDSSTQEGGKNTHVGDAKVFDTEAIDEKILPLL